MSKAETFRTPLRDLLRRSLRLVVAVALLAVSGSSARSQQSDSAQKPARKLLSQIEPEYPRDLKRAAIGGMVRLDIVVAPGGKVDSIIVTGGNPILAESAMRAVKQWRYAPATSSTNMRINVRFDPSR